MENNSYRKLCVFSSDPIKEYYDKGEIKKRYFNPENFFDEVHIISFIDQDIDESKVKILVGKAKLKIHSIGKISIRERAKNLERVKKLVSEINPDVIRAYNSLLQGWFAAKCAVTLKKPFLLSLHTQYDHRRKLLKKIDFKKYLFLKYTERFIEPYVIKHASKIIIVYKIIEPYVIKHGHENPEYIPNKVETDRFSKSIVIDGLPKPLVLSIGNLIKEKNHECIILAMKNLDAHCLIIGKGENKKKLLELIDSKNLKNKISIIDSVPHSKIQNYYKSATIFALAYDPELEGLPMPVMEALATGLPVVIPQPKSGLSDDLQGIVMYSERKPVGFSHHINELLNDEKMRKQMKIKGLEKSKDFDSNKIEEKEAHIYSKLIKLENN
jgi:glycosyltransferase involved in cell wall biosynthesis